MNLTFQALLRNWYEQNKRILPWRSEPVPYYVWLSEIILQQTRVSQGLNYFLHFVERWPKLEDLASASEEEVLKMWQGLGYYSRARNLHRCAIQVSTQYGGAFPADYAKLKQLQGIGDYTAAAIASIAFNLPYAVVDGNVYRVISRLYDIETPINSREGRQCIAQIADELLDHEHPGLHNQAMMEFGALHCIPKNPDCQNCPIQAHCLSYTNHTTEKRPVKQDKTKTRTRYFNYLVLKTDGSTYLHQRGTDDIWAKLYDFPLIESEKAISVDEVIVHPLFHQIVEQNSFTVGKVSRIFTHKLTHQTLIVQFIEIILDKKIPNIETKNIFLTSEKDLGQFPIPRLIDLYLNS